jgi:outer membrane immunogenic protein
MKRILLAGVIALAAGAQALAADLPPPMAPPPRAPAAYIPAPPAWNWSGFYIGLNGGYGFGRSTWTGANGLTSGSFSDNGGQFGGTVGGNYQIGQLVLGIEGDYDWQGLRGASNSAPCAAVGVGFAGNCATSSSWIGTFRGRIGYAFDRIMIYATGGGAVTDIKASQTILPWASSTELGWTAGAGIEGAITDNLTAKVEYLYAGFEKSSCPAASCGLTPAAAPVSVGLNESMVRVGLNYKFGFGY